jgi:type VI secretion system protein ImpC
MNVEVSDATRCGWPPLIYDRVTKPGDKAISLPFVVVILANLFSESQSNRPLHERKTLGIDLEASPGDMRRFDVRVRLDVSGGAGNAGLEARLKFDSIEDFRAENVGLQVAPVAALAHQRRLLANLLARCQGNAGLSASLSNLLVEPGFTEGYLSDHAADESLYAESGKMEVFAVTRSKPLDALIDNAMLHAEREELYRQLRALCSRLSETRVRFTGELESQLARLIDGLDEIISTQIKRLLQHADYQAVEATWRGIFYLVESAHRAPNVQVRLYHVSKDELREIMASPKESSLDDNPIYRTLSRDARESYYDSRLIGETISCLVGDYFFDGSSADVRLLDGMCRIGEALHAPFITSVSPQAISMETWEELSRPSDLARIFQSPDYADWRALRETPHSAFLVLTLPRILLRRPANDGLRTADSANLREGPDGNEHLWGNAAYAAAGCIVRAFIRDAWCARIAGFESGGLAQSLPTHDSPSCLGDMTLVGPTDVDIDDRRLGELMRLGFTPLVRSVAERVAVFLRVQGLRRIPDHQPPDKRVGLRNQLGYILTVSRYIHYCVILLRINPNQNQQDAFLMINEWLRSCTEGAVDKTGQPFPESPFRSAAIRRRDVGQKSIYELEVSLSDERSVEGESAAHRESMGHLFSSMLAQLRLSASG